MKTEDVPELNELSGYTSWVTDDIVVPIKEAIDPKRLMGDRYSSGLKVFDLAINGGFKDGDLIIISGISGMGKTTYAQTLTYNLCKKSVPCLWFSYEVMLEFLNEKFLSMGIDDFYYAYTPKKNVSGQIGWIKLKIREAWLKYACKVVFIDHIDFLTPEDIKTADNQQVSYKNIVTQLKSLAIELGVAIVLMAHTKKGDRDDREPEMQDIGYSAGIFQLADLVFMVSRERVEQPRKLSNRENSGDLYTNNSIIRLIKNRETGKNCFLKAVYNQGRFQELTENYETTSEGNPSTPQFWNEGK